MSDYRQDFYNDVYSSARELGATDAQAHLAAAQASQETGFGRSMVGYNPFGIKAGVSWDGPTVNAATHEYVDGRPIGIRDTFRAFASLPEAIAGYMGFMGQNFADAWNSPDISSAAANLTNGRFGSYATDPNYSDKIASIANKYGQFTYAANPENVPVPYSPTDDPFAASQQAQATTGISGVVNPPTPQAVEQGGLLAPPSNPIDVSATGSIGVGAGPNLSAQTGGLLPGTRATADIGIGAGLLGAANAGMVTPASASLGVGASTPASAFAGAMPSSQSFDVSRFNSPDQPSGFNSMAFAGPIGPMNTQEFDTNRFGPQTVSSFDQNRFGPTPGMGLLSTPQSYMDGATVNAPATASVGVGAGLPAGATVGATPSVADFDAGRFGPTSRVGQVASFDQNRFGPTPGMGLLSTPQSYFSAPAQAPTAPSGFAQMAEAGPSVSPVGGLLSGYTAAPSTTPAEAAIGAITSSPSISPSAISGYQQMADTAQAGGITTLGGTTLVGPTGTATSFTGTPVSAPSQPSTDIEGPATTPAAAQTVSAPVSQPAQVSRPSISAGAFPAAPAAPKAGLLGGLLSKEAIAGGLLGGMIAGPAGSIAGGLLGRAAGQNGGVFGGGNNTSFGPTQNIGGGVANTGSVYGGAPRGTQATTSNGGVVTSLGNGSTAYTSPSGVTSVTTKEGYNVSYNGPSIPGTPGYSGHSGVDTSGFSPGLW